MRRTILLFKPPFFTPLAPPLGIALLKAHIAPYGYEAKCLDLNTKRGLWEVHHQYFRVLQAHNRVAMRDGYSRLWWILNTHMLAYVNGADADTCSTVLRSIIPVYALSFDRLLIKELHRIVVEYFERMDRIIDETDLGNVSIAGTSTYTTSLASSIHVLRRIKQKACEIKTVMGGGVFADDLAPGTMNLDTLLKAYGFIDHIIVGEGEGAFLNLLRNRAQGKRLIGPHGHERYAEDAWCTTVPDFSDLDPANYYHLAVEGSRSCPYRCQFCSETLQWGEYRRKPISGLVDEMVVLKKKYGKTTFFMADSVMNPYITQFAAELTKRKANVLYDGYLRPEGEAGDETVVKRWAESGLYRVRLGVESGASHVLKLMKKKTKPEEISRVLKILARAGVRTTAYFVVGYPGETEKDFQETVDFVWEHRRHIYELEAHPYYFYPSGQAGNPPGEVRSLYPECVNEVIKFQQWEIANEAPDHEEKYDRLRRLSQVATAGGLPNVYSIGDLYEAEDRWARILPKTKRIYDGVALQDGEKDGSSTSTGKATRIHPSLE